MTNIIIIHGSYGNPNENWFPWLKSELKKLKCNVFIPKFPTPENQSLKSWEKEFKKYKRHINENTILIGHSLGPAFLLNLLESLDKPVKSAFFISGFLGLLSNPDFDEINKTFTDRNFNWEKIKQNCKKFNIYHSDNDPYIPIKKATELAEKLDSKVIKIKNAGHFNEKAGYKKFELLLENIKKYVD